MKSNPAIATKTCAFLLALSGNATPTEFVGTVITTNTGCAGPPILAQAFSGPKYVGVIDVMVVVSGPMGKTFETTCRGGEITTNPSSKHRTKHARSAELHADSVAQCSVV